MHVVVVFSRAFSLVKFPESAVFFFIYYYYFIFFVPQKVGDGGMKVVPKESGVLQRYYYLLRAVTQLERDLFAVIVLQSYCCASSYLGQLYA